MNGDMTCRDCGQVITESAAARVDRLGAEYASIKERGRCIACYWEHEFKQKAERIRKGGL